MNEEIAKRSGPRRWSDDWLYSQFAKQQDRLFEITADLTNRYMQAETTMGKIREDMARGEARQIRRWNGVLAATVSVLVGLLINFFYFYMTSHGGK